MSVCLHRPFLTPCGLLFVLLTFLPHSPAQGEPDYLIVPAPEIWTTPPIRPEGFQFEVQMSSSGTSYDRDLLRTSIEAHVLGEYDSAVSSVIAAEWGYSFTHLDGMTDGAGREIEAGYPTPPADRAECLRVIEAFLHRQYIRGADRPWASMNGHFPWHHYAAEFGFDQIGSEIGENINNYQWHIALNRGAARQYRKPWFIDFSAWHGPSITDYSEGRIWGEHSGPDYGHSMSLFERSLFMSYIAGAGQITAEAGGAIAFLTERDETGHYKLSPYGEVCKRFREFTLAHPDVGIPYTPIAIVLDRFHGAYPGFEGKKAFGYFDYTPGDEMTWNLIDMIWPGGWEVMDREETGSLVNGPYGDLFDVLLQNAPQDVLNSYPCLVLSGDIRLSPEEQARYAAYVEQGGTLVLNTMYADQFAEFGTTLDNTEIIEHTVGKGLVVSYGPDHDVSPLDTIIRRQLDRFVPFTISPGIEYLINVADDAVYLTLINNDGVTKAPREKTVTDATKRMDVSVSRLDGTPLGLVQNLLGDAQETLDGALHIPVGPGEVAVLRIQTAAP